MRKLELYVTAKPASRENKIEKIDETHVRVSVKEPPIQGRANAAILKLLAEYFNVPLSAVRIARGHTFREKLIIIDND